jgi:signal transduction histidine kinase
MLMQNRNQPARASSDPTAGGQDSDDSITTGAPAYRVRNRLFFKYVVLFVSVVGFALLANGLFEAYFYYGDYKAALVRIQREQAEAAAAKINQFIKEIENQLGWTTQLPWSGGSIEQRRFDALRLLRQVPAITELSQLDETGKERLRVSRLAMDVVDSGADFSTDAKFTDALKHKVYYGPVYFRRESEPYMTLAIAGSRRGAGVSVAEVNLKLIWDVVSQIKVGERGYAYVVDAQGRLVAHPDISLVLRNTDMSRLAQIKAAREGGEHVQEADNIQGRKVLTAYAPISPLGWLMFVELPIGEANAPLKAVLLRLAWILLVALSLAAFAGVFLARRMVGPIRVLRVGAARIGAGDLSQRISVKTGDELEALADQFNDMAGKLRESHAGLEKKVTERTHELSESLRQQSATADVLQVISRSAFDLQPVFNTVAESSVKLCEANQAMILRFDGELLRMVADFNSPPEYKEWIAQHPIPLGRHSAAARAALERQTVHIPDVQADPEYSYGAKNVQPIRTVLGVPMLKGDDLLGVIIIYRFEVRPFTDKQIALVETFADQSAIAIENVRLFEEVQQRTEALTESLRQQTATADVLKVISRSAFDLPTVLQTLVESAARLCEAGKANIIRQKGGGFYVTESCGYSQEFMEAVKDLQIEPTSGLASGRALLEGHVVHIPDVEADPDYTFAAKSLGDYRTILAVPMLREGEAIGVFVLTRPDVRPFTDKQIETAQTFADQAAIAIENVRLFDSVEARTRELAKSLEELRTAQDRLVQTEKLASLGQLTAGIAHEIKNPLNFVNNFSSLAIELIDELEEALQAARLDDKVNAQIAELADMLKGNLGKVVEHGKRADSIVKNMLLHSRRESGEHRPVDINALVAESLNLAYHGARAAKQGFNITLEQSLDPAAGKVDVFPQEIIRVLLNLISNGFYAATKRKAEPNSGDYEPTLTAMTKDLGDSVEIRIRDNGTGIPAEVRDKLFNPFFTTKPPGEGTGLGLSLSYDIIVKQHSGSIEVDTQPGEFTEFRIVLPRSAASGAQPGERQ